MARPKLTALRAEIERRGGAEWMYEQIIEGRRLGEIASELGCSIGLLYQWRDLGEGSEGRKAGWAEAMLLSADTKADQAEEAIDGLGEEGKLLTPALVAAAKAKADMKQWQARMRNRDKYSEQQQAVNLNMNLNMNGAFLDALRIRQVDAGPTVDAEVLAEGEGVIDAPLVERTGEEDVVGLLNGGEG